MKYNNNWTTPNFVTNRTYMQKTDGTTHNNLIVATSSVPQGSQCGPLRILQYADDTKFFAVVNNSNEMKNMQKTINKLSLWSNQNRLGLNQAKTYHISSSKRKDKTFNSHYYLGETRIQNVQVMIDLGVLFDNHLSFKQHIEEIIAKTIKLFGMTQRFSYDIRSPQLLMKILNTYLHYTHHGILLTKLDVKSNRHSKKNGKDTSPGVKNSIAFAI